MNLPTLQAAKTPTNKEEKVAPAEKTEEVSEAGALTAPEIDLDKCVDFDIDYHDWIQIIRDLECFHGIFAKLWQIGRPQFTTQIPTACVVFDKRGGYVNFLFNPEYWKKSTDTQRLFIICHECLHLLLNHGRRQTSIPQFGKPIANIAMDIVVNHLLVKGFSFDRKEVDPNNELCWMDTVFLNDKTIEHGKFFEYYYNKLMNEHKEKFKQALKEGKIKVRLVDSHDQMEGTGDKELDEMLEDMAKSLSKEEQMELGKQLEKKMTPDQTSKEWQEAKLPGDNAQGGKEAGTAAGNKFIQILLNKIVFKKKWETVIRDWAIKHITEEFKLEDQWAKKHRRHSMFNDTGYFLPSEAESCEPIDEKKKIEVWFFQDTSGSCAHLAERFFKAAASLPPEHFEVKLHCFDTKVYETDLKTKKLYGFGGTSFSCIEQYIQANKHKCLNKQYPQAIFAVTDGYGDNVTPQSAKSWYWFLSEDYKQCIPKESKTYMLKDFE